MVFAINQQQEERMDQSETRESTAEMKQLISFTVGAEEYGLELLRVKEVIRLRFGLAPQEQTAMIVGSLMAAEEQR
jgi:chemotaxis signal transduction protein